MSIKDTIKSVVNDVNRALDEIYEAESHMDGAYKCTLLSTSDLADESVKYGHLRKAAAHMDAAYAILRPYARAGIYDVEIGGIRMEVSRDAERLDRLTDDVWCSYRADREVAAIRDQVTELRKSVRERSLYLCELFKGEVTDPAMERKLEAFERGQRQKEEEYDR